MEVASNKFIYHLGQSFPNIFSFADWWVRSEEGRFLCAWRSSLRMRNSICASCSCKYRVFHCMKLYLRMQIHILIVHPEKKGVTVFCVYLPHTLVPWLITNLENKCFDHNSATSSFVPLWHSFLGTCFLICTL